jgi:hypothetical protein
MFDFHPCGYKLDRRFDGTNKCLIFTYDFVLTFTYFNKALMTFVGMCYQHLKLVGFANNVIMTIYGLQQIG